MAPVRVGDACLEVIMRVIRLSLAIVGAACLLVPSLSSGQDDFEAPPISYSDSTPDNRVSRLVKAIEDGEVTLATTREQGYLPSLLEALKVPVESQMLVFSKTSLQTRRISPRTPRAIYFSDDVYVGYCMAGDVIEITAVDPKLGAVFYTLDQTKPEIPQVKRQTDSCLVCHSSSRTAGVPGHLARSLFVDRGGQPIFSAGSHMVDYTTPIEDRWGGWYVTGTHGAQQHLGNLVIEGNRVDGPVDNSAGQNVRNVTDRFNTSRYLSPHSDIVALMVFEHQIVVHNRITKANFATRQALEYDKTMKEALGESDDKLLDSTQRRIESAAGDLVDALLLVGEATLTEPVEGTSGFGEMFTKQGPRDPQGRSLRQLDLERRLWVYPCSYVIYSEAFDALPPQTREVVWRRLAEILSGEDTAQKYAHLSADDRRAIAEILLATKQGIPPEWKSRLATNSVALSP
jgi:hypothetical protein